MWRTIRAGGGELWRDRARVIMRRGVVRSGRGGCCKGGKDLGRGDEYTEGGDGAAENNGSGRMERALSGPEVRAPAMGRQG